MKKHAIGASDTYATGLLGTAEIVEYQNKKGGLPTRNWDSGTFEGWQAIDGKTMAKTILKERDTCYAARNSGSFG